VEEARNADVFISQAGSGLLKFTSSFTGVPADAGTITAPVRARCRLHAIAGATGEVAGAIVDTTGSPTLRTEISKLGPGTWTLSGNNTFTGIDRAQCWKAEAGLQRQQRLQTVGHGERRRLAALYGGTLELAGGSHTETVLSTSLDRRHHA
jgi:hypothetical protein